MPSLSRLGMHAPVVLTFAFPENASVVDSVLFVADDDYEVVDVAESHITKGSDGGAVTLDLKKAASGTAVTSGTSVLASTFDLKSDNNTPVRKTVANGGVHQTKLTRTITKGQQLGVDFTGTVTAVAGMALTLVLKRVRFTPGR